MSEKELSKEESLELITHMIRQAKSNYNKGGSIYFLLWGWVIMIANLSHYVIDAHTDYPNPSLVWLITFPAAIASVFISYRQSKNAVVMSHLDRMYGQVWLAVGFGIILSLVFMSKLGFNHSPVILFLAAIGTYVSGNLLKFKPLIFGGICLGIGSIIGFSVGITEQYLVAGIAILFGYLVPGYLLKSKENE